MGSGRRVFLRLIKAAFYLVYLVGAVLAFLYLFFWRPFVADLSMSEDGRIDGRTATPFVDLPTIRLLGVSWFSKESHFVRFREQKDEGMVRICALGDSNTAGAETGERHDYPSYLQRQFDSLGAVNAEVLNFGNGWYGFSQTFLLWERVASRFQCDVVLLHPFAFWERRDTTFHHADFVFPYYLHARHVMEDGRLRLLEVIGKSDEERLDNYYRFFPRLRYLRYDRSPPLLLRAITSRAGTLRNPFYYDRRPSEDEVRDLYVHFVEKIADASASVIVGVYDDRTAATMESVNRSNVTVLKGLNLYSFPYRAPTGNHFSPWGNELRALENLGWLLGERMIPIEMVTATDVPLADEAGGEQRLDRYDSLSIELAGEEVGYIVPDVTSNYLQQHLFRSTLSGSGAAALLVLKDTGASLADVCFLSLDHAPRQGTEIRLTPPVGGSDISRPVGRVTGYLPATAIAVAEVPGVGCQFWDGRITYQLEGSGAAASREVEGLKMTLGGRVILDGAAMAYGNTVHFQEPAVSVYRLGALGDYEAGVGSLPDSGTFDLVLSGEGLETVRVPFLRWRKEEIPSKSVNPRPPLSLGPGGRVMPVDYSR